MVGAILRKSKVTWPDAQNCNERFSNSCCLSYRRKKKSLSKSRTPFCAAFSCSHRVPRDVKKQSETISYHPKRARLKSQKVAAFLVKVKLWHIWRQIRRKLTIFMHVFNGGDENHGISDAQLSFREHNSKYTFENTFFRILVLGSYYIITFGTVRFVHLKISSGKWINILHRWIDE